MKHTLCILGFYFMCLAGNAQEKEYRILFDFNKTELPDSSMLGLIKIITMNKIEKVLIEGHCDSIGSKEYNYSLSEMRAKKVQKLLVENGINKHLIKTCIGYGKDQPITSNASESDRQLNRRVLVHFTIAEPSKKEIAKPSGKLKSTDFKVGEKIVLDNLLFYGGQHVLQPESRPVLENLCSIMQENPKLTIEIHGHVCCTTIEKDGYDIDTRTDNLSVTRAEMIYNYLKNSCGINKKRLSYKGFGGTRKIIENDLTEEQQKINRRVEINVIGE